MRKMNTSNYKDDFQFIEKSPTVEDYQRLRSQVGWSKVNDEAVSISLKNAIFSVCLVHKGDTIGFGRIVGDNGIYYYIQDVIIDQEFRGKGFGKKIMEKLMKYLEDNADPTCFIGLMVAKGYAGFYEKYNFKIRKEDSPGMFRYLKLK